MKLTSFPQNQSGFSMIEMLMVAGIGAIVSLIMASMIVENNKHASSLEKRVEMAQTTNVVSQVLNPSRQVASAGGSTDSLCNCMLDPSKNTSQRDILNLSASALTSASAENPVVIAVNKIPKSCEAGATAFLDLTDGRPKQYGKLTIESIQFVIDEPVSNTSTSVLGKWVINVKENQHVHAPKAIEISQLVNLTPPNSGNRTVASCVASGAGNSASLPTTCPANQYLTQDDTGRWVCAEANLPGCTHEGRSYETGEMRVLRSHGSGCGGSDGSSLCINGRWADISRPVHSTGCGGGGGGGGGG